MAKILDHISKYFGHVHKFSYSNPPWTGVDKETLSFLLQQRSFRKFWVPVSPDQDKNICSADKIDISLRYQKNHYQEQTLNANPYD